ncbi:hypothetical protein B808_426 [Fructilactobacillus florum 8D]|uniref:Uncharacterized protein n=1 Tax=Fructilactobacillus florum 8D TaxID=1221538 RepID=W9EEX0_9LACO|nr:SIR2 family protein [Fructilactobacillus florum]ETO40627.1 hypothetical protein B808_426 [Fructilactobacillus florum 8D]
MSDNERDPFWLSKNVKLCQGVGSENEKFYKNGVEIKEDNNSIDLDEFKKMVKNESLKFLNNKFDNIVVLVGAGASVTDNNFQPDEHGIAKTGVTVAKIADVVQKKLADKKYHFDEDEEDFDVFTLAEMAEMSSYSDNILDNGKKLNGEFNLEDFLSNILAYEKFVPEADQEKFKNTKKIILDIIIKATSYNYDRNTFKHVKFLNVLSKLTNPENKLNLVTTNYDTLLEDAAESMKWTVFDGFSFSQTPQFDSTMFDWNLVKEVPNVKTNENIYKINVANLLKIHGSLTWERSESGDNIIRKDKKLVKEPIMVFPSSNKYAQSYQEPYFDLFNKFQNLLHKPNTLLITTGFSFADNHIARMIISAIQTNDGLSTLITNFSINESQNSNSNLNELINAMDNYYNVAFLKATLNGDLSEYLGGSMDDN